MTCACPETAVVDDTRWAYSRELGWHTPEDHLPAEEP